MEGRGCVTQITKNLVARTAGNFIDLRLPVILLIIPAPEFLSLSRIGLFHGYRILKGGKKIYERDCLQNKTLGRGTFISNCYL